MGNDSKQVNEIQTMLSTYLKSKERDVRQTPKPASNKRDSSQLSPPLQTNPKKANMDTENQSDLVHGNGTTTIPSNSPVPISSRVLTDIVGPIVQEVWELKESVHLDYSKLYNNYSRLEGNYSKLEGIITSQQQVISKLETTISTKQKEVTVNLTVKIEENTANINAYIRENKWLCKENTELKDRLTKIELSQLDNNLIISGMQEQLWEGNDTTKEHVYDTIAVAMGRKDQAEVL